jgi:hypothetical protein
MIMITTVCDSEALMADKQRRQRSMVDSGNVGVCLPVAVGRQLASCRDSHATLGSA